MNWVVMHAPQLKGESDPLSPAAILDEVGTRPLLRDADLPKVVLIRGADIYFQARKSGDAESSSGDAPRDIFERNLENIPENSALVFDIATPGNLKSTRFYKAIEAMGAVVLCESLRNQWGGESPDSPLCTELEKRGAALGLDMTARALMAITGRCGQNLGVLEEEMGKIALALSAKPNPDGKGQLVEVTDEHIEAICADVRMADAFEFAEALSDRDAKRALESLDRIFSHGLGDYRKPGKVITNESEIGMRVLGAVTYKITQLQDLRAALDSGAPDFQAFQAAKLFGPRQNAARNQLKKHNAATLRKAVEALLQANFDMRSPLEKQAALEKLVWAVCR
jgi:DNA polymerase III delta subunit